MAPPQALRFPPCGPALTTACVRSDLVPDSRHCPARSPDFSRHLAPRGRSGGDRCRSQPPAGGGRDSSTGCGRRRTGPAVPACEGFALPCGDQSVRHGRPRGSSLRLTPAGVGGPCRSPAATADAAYAIKALAGEGSAAGAVAPGTQPSQPRAGPPQHHCSAAADRLAGVDHLDTGRRPVPHPGPGLHRTSRSRRSQPRDLPHAGPRPGHHRHALADRQGRRLPPPPGRKPRPGSAGGGVPGRAAGTDALRHRPVAGERAGTAAHLSAAGSPRAHDPQPALAAACSRRCRICPAGPRPRRNAAPGRSLR